MSSAAYITDGDAALQEEILEEMLRNRLCAACPLAAECCQQPVLIDCERISEVIPAWKRRTLH